MTMDQNYDHNTDDGGIPVHGENLDPSGGIYELRGAGNGLVAVRRFFDGMIPQETDSTGVRTGKEVLRWGTVVGGAVVGGAVAAVVAL